MAKFVIQCSTTVSYHLVVEAPSEEAALAFYDNNCDHSEFNKTDEYGWEFNDIYQDEYAWGHDADCTVNEEGEKI